MSEPPQPAVSIRSLIKRFGSNTVLPGLDLDIAPGELFALLGPNGSGKTTLFRILATLLRPDSGSARICGFDAMSEPAAVRGKIGVVFQSPSLDKKLTVRENLRYGGALYGLHGSPLSTRIDELSHALHIREKLHSLVETLSGGQQRRVEIAKCLLARPDLLLLDEPSTGLDPTARMDLWALVAGLRNTSGMTVVFTTHLMDEAARADRVGILCDGQLVATAPPDVLLAEAGPEILRVSTHAEIEVAGFLRDSCGLAPHVLEGEIRAAAQSGHETARQLAEALPDSVLSTTVAKPTLEDVFLFKTGKRLHE